MEVTKISFGKDNLPGYIVGNVNDPAVLVIQEWWGVNDLVKGHAQKIAAQGYRCLIPDVYHGKIGIDKEEASHHLENLDWMRAVEELKQAVEYLKAGGATKIGSIGWCMGGALSLAAAQHCDINCALPFYGTPSTQLAQPENVTAPISIHVGALDNYAGFSDPATMKDWADKINAGGKTTAEYFEYANCGHAFLNPLGGEGTEKREHMGFPEPPNEQQELAWQRVFTFLDKHLKSGKKVVEEGGGEGNSNGDGGCKCC